MSEAVPTQHMWDIVCAYSRHPLSRAFAAVSPSCRIALEYTNWGYMPYPSRCITRSGSDCTIHLLQSHFTSEVLARVLNYAMTWLRGSCKGHITLKSTAVSGVLELDGELLGLITHLDFFCCTELTGLRIKGATPQLRCVDLTGCVNLEEVYFASPQLTEIRAGGVQGTGLQRVLDSLPPHRTTLRSLDLSKSPISALTEVEYCTALESLDITSCRGVTNFAPLGKLEKLRVVRAARTKMQDVMWVTSCRNLEVLDVSGNGQLTDLSPVAALLNLRELRAQHTPITNAQWIIRCRSLRVLDLSYCDRLWGELPVDALPHLVEFHIPFSLPHESLACFVTDGFSQLRILGLTPHHFYSNAENLVFRGEYLSRITKLVITEGIVAIDCLLRFTSLEEFEGTVGLDVDCGVLRHVTTVGDPHLLTSSDRLRTDFLWIEIWRRLTTLPLHCDAELQVSDWDQLNALTLLWL